MLVFMNNGREICGSRTYYISVHDLVKASDKFLYSLYSCWLHIVLTNFNTIFRKSFNV